MGRVSFPVTKLSAALASLAFLTLGCTVEKFAPHPVAMGVSRLTVRNSALVLKTVTEDTACGFQSSAVVGAPIVQGKVGEMGQVQWRVNNCRLDFGSQIKNVSEDCNGIHTSASGAVTVSGTKTIVGMLTGDAQNPVIPNAADAVSFDLNVQFDHLTVKVDQQREFLTWLSGSVAFTAKPYLASSASVGLCSVPTRNLSMDSISYAPSKVHIEDKDHQFDADVDASSYGALVGKWGTQENVLTHGALSVWGTSITVPWSGDNRGSTLDIYYDTNHWVDSYTCTADLKLPVSYACATPATVESQGAARLSISAFGNFAIYVDDNKVCGFSNPQVLNTPALTGTLGNNDGVAVYTLPPCTLRFPEKTVIATDCNGVQQVVQGDVTISGTKTVRGIYTGNAGTPIVPTTWEPAEVNLRLDMANFTFSDLPSRSITFNSGSVSGLITARTAQDTTTGACSLKTPVAGFQHVNIQAADILLKSNDLGLKVKIDNSDLTAQNGQGTRYTNYLAGTVTLQGNVVTLPTTGDSIGLDPDYSAGKFTGTYSCKANQRIAETAEQCSMKQTLAENAARLLVQNAATAAAVVAQDTSCGFDFNYEYNTQWLPDSTLRNPIQSSGDASGLGSLTFHTENCQVLRGTVPQLLATDCTGNRTVAVGDAVVTGNATVSGQRFKEFVFFDAIFPIAHDGVQMNLEKIALNGFSAYTLPPNASTPSAQLTVHSGTLSLQMAPLAGQRVSKPDHFDVLTPVASLPSITASQVKATLVANGLTFNLDIPSAQLQAFNGSFAGNSNSLSGQMVMGDSPVSFHNLPLDPNFKQAAFDASYACTKDLMSVLAP